VVVTGGVGGIGQAISETFKKAGADVIATGINQKEIDDKRNDAALTGITLAPLDVGDVLAVEAFANTISELDILVNCAGTTARGAEAFEEEAFTHVLNVNLTGTMRLCRAFYDKLARKKGKIVNIASVMSFFGSGTAPGYAASKGGVAQLTRSLAIAWSDDGIRVNAVAPGWIITPLTEAQIDPELRAKVTARTPMGQWGKPQYIADAVEFLCSPQAEFITGAILPVDGGYTIA